GCGVNSSGGLGFGLAPRPANFYVDHPNPITPWSPQWISPRSPRRDPNPFRKLSMPALVILDSISLSTPDGRPLFDGLTLAVGRERTWLVGRNGCGKSTLLRLISGEVEPVKGTIHRAGSIGVLAQHVDEQLDVAAALGVAGPLARLQRLERGEGTLDDADGADWRLPSQIETALADIGLPGMD